MAAMFSSPSVAVIPGRAKREPGIHTHGALGPWAIRANQQISKRAFIFFHPGRGEGEARNPSPGRAWSWGLSRKPKEKKGRFIFFREGGKPQARWWLWIPGLRLAAHPGMPMKNLTPPPLQTSAHQAAAKFLPRSP